MGQDPWSRLGKRWYNTCSFTCCSNSSSQDCLRSQRAPSRNTQQASFLLKPKIMYPIRSNYLQEKSLYYINRSGFILPNWNWKCHPTDLKFMKKEEISRLQFRSQESWITPWRWFFLSPGTMKGAQGSSAQSYAGWTSVRQVTVVMSDHI